MDSSITSSGNNESHFVSNNSSTGSSAKKRKLSIGEMSSTNIELEILRSTIQKWKEYAQKLESEKRQHIDGCNQEKILELEETVKKLNARNAELQTYSEQHHSEIQTIFNENTAKIKIYESEKKEFESKMKGLRDEISTMKTIKLEIKDSVENERENAQNETAKLKAEIKELKNKAETFEDEKIELETKIQELTDEISTMKTIKSEIKDSVESERETCQTEIQTLKAETQKLKDKNHILEIKSQEAESMHLNSEKKNKEIKKKYDEKTVENKKLEQKCKTMEATISKNKKEYQSKIDELKAENQELKKRIQVVENKKLEEIVLFDDVSNGSKLDLSLLSCNSNIMNVSKIESSPEGWKLYSTLNCFEKPRLLTEKDMTDARFKMNITDQFIATRSSLNLHRIMLKINTCQLAKLYLDWQTINYVDYLKLVSSKKIQVCILRSCTVLKEQNKCDMDELLMHLPNITEFEYSCHSLKENFSKIAKNLGKLDEFRNLLKFEITHFLDTFNFEYMDSFIKKNNKDIRYVFEFRLIQQKSTEAKIKSSEKKLLEALPPFYNIKVELRQ